MKDSFYHVIIIKEIDNTDMYTSIL